MSKFFAAPTLYRDEVNPDFLTENVSFEAWLKCNCDVVQDDLDYKHSRMTKNAFVFLRATFFRWAKQIGTKCPELKTAPVGDAVGDLHTENFGTWRDGDGRLVWGVNDFDDADTIPYAYDLVRLRTCALLAKHPNLHPKQTADAILDGYWLGLKDPGPTLVHQRARWILPLVRSNGRNFYPNLDDPQKCPSDTPPGKVALALTKSLPRHASPPQFKARLKVGGGGLGRPRYLAISEWQGGLVIREAKAWVPSAWSWAHGAKSSPKVFLPRARGANRSRDPALRIDPKSRFIIRRLAADSQKIRLGDRPGSELSKEVLKGMGFETAAIHATNAAIVAALERDLLHRGKDWLHDAAETMRAAVDADFHVWKRYYSP
jgi:uncharacterized protein (DUF2252 family)